MRKNILFILILILCQYCKKDYQNDSISKEYIIAGNSEAENNYTINYNASIIDSSYTDYKDFYLDTETEYKILGLVKFSFREII